MMKHNTIYRFTMILALLFTFTLTGCSEDDANALADKAVKLNNQIAQKLKEVKDSETAKKVKEDIAKLEKELKETSVKIAKVSSEKAQELKKQYGDKLKNASEEVQKEIQRIAASSDIKDKVAEQYNKIKQTIHEATAPDTKTNTDTTNKESDTKPADNPTENKDSTDDKSSN